MAWGYSLARGAEQDNSHFTWLNGALSYNGYEKLTYNYYKQVWVYELLYLRCLSLWCPPIEALFLFFD